MTKMIIDMTSNEYVMDQKDLWSEKKKQQRGQLEIPNSGETQHDLKELEKLSWRMIPNSCRIQQSSSV